VNEARTLLPSDGTFIAQQVSIGARHQLHIYKAIFVKVDPPTDQDLFIQAIEPALSRAFDEALSIDVLKDSDACPCSKEQVSVSISVEVLPCSKAQITDSIETDL